MTKRIYPLDYLKCVFIVLMIVFHLAYIGDKYPYIKQIVYTFHMPAFLLISGYLFNNQKRIRLFVYSIIWIFIPYAIMETGYVFMSAVLPVRERIEEVSIQLLLNKIFVTPMGPYWYLHTLIICHISCYLVRGICSCMKKVSFFIILGLVFWVLADWINMLSMSSAIFFMIGFIIRQCKQNFMFIFQPSIWGIFPLIILCCDPANLNRFTLAGVIITYFSITIFLWVYNYIPQRIKFITYFIGGNTFTILLFSPIFTIASKVFIPIFSFDSSGFCFIFTAVVLVVIGSLSIAWCMDKLGLSYWFCGKMHLLYNDSCHIGGHCTKSHLKSSLN